MNAYTPRRLSRTSRVVVRGLSYNVRHWGEEGSAPLLLLHGTRDTSATFQFMVDELAGDWHVVSPDWRGHGHSDRSPAGYWFHDFIADLDELADALFGGAAVPLVGHSLGGNIAGVYAGLRPHRVSRLVSLDGFGPLVGKTPVDPLALLTDVLNRSARSAGRRPYRGVDDAADRLRRANPRLDAAKARFLAAHSVRSFDDGSCEWLHDPAYRASTPSLRSLEEWGRIWRAIEAPALWVVSHDQRPGAPFATFGEIDRRAAMMPAVHRIELAGTGHNLHHDAPGAVARRVEAFIADPAALVHSAEKDTGQNLRDG